MKKSYCLLLLIIFYISPLYSEERINQKILNLQKKLAAVTAAEKVDVLNDLAIEYQGLDGHKSIEYAVQARELARKTNDWNREITAIENIINGYKILGDYKKVLEYGLLLQNIYEEKGDKKGTAKTYNIIGDAYDSLGDNDKAMEFTQKGLKISEEIGNEKEKSNSLYNLGFIYMHQNKYPKALDYFRQVQKFGEEIGDKKIISACLRSSSIVYIQKGDYSKALELLKKAWENAEEIGDKQGMTLIWNNLGSIHRKIGNYKKSLEYRFKVLKIHEETGNELGISACLLNIGNVYSDLGNYNRALEYFLKALPLQEKINDKLGIVSSLNSIGTIYYQFSNFTKSIEYYQKTIKIAEEIGNVQIVALVLTNIGVSYIKLGDYDKAIDYSLRALKINEEIGSKSGIANCLESIGEAYLKKRKYSQAEKHLKEALKNAIEIKEKIVIKDIYDVLSELYAAKNDHQKAYEYQSMCRKLEKEIYDEDSSKKIAELQVRYDTELKEKDNEFLRKKNEVIERDRQIQILKVKKERASRNAFIIGLLFVSTILVILFYKYLYLFAFWKKQTYVGQYRLIKKIGTGGFGTVYKAHHIRDKTHIVAVKILNEDMLDESSLKRFNKESEYIEKLVHPNIIKVYERGVDAKSNARYIAMELLEGSTLTDILQEKGSGSPIKDSLHMMIQITDALMQIHSQGIIHRDIKPGNIMIINKNGDSLFVKLLDFGIATTRHGTRLTKTGNFMGSENYVSPEQIKGDKTVVLSTQSDIFSLGIVFYEMITGKKSEDINYRIMNDLKFDDFFVVDKTVPNVLLNLIKAMLHKEPDKRPEAQTVLQKLKEIDITTV